MGLNCFRKKKHGFDSKHHQNAKRKKLFQISVQKKEELAAISYEQKFYQIIVVRASTCWWCCHIQRVLCFRSKAPAPTEAERERERERGKTLSLVSKPNSLLLTRVTSPYSNRESVTQLSRAPKILPPRSFGLFKDSFKSPNEARQKCPIWRGLGPKKPKNQGLLSFKKAHGLGFGR